MYISIQYFFFSFWLTSLCITGSGFIHLIRTHSNAFLFVAESYSIVYMYHSFFIHSSVDGHLGSFHVLAIVNSAKWILGYVGLFQFGFPQVICLIVGWLGHMVVLFLVFFKEIYMLSSIVAISVSIPTNSERGFLFLHTLSSIHCRLFDDGHSDWCEVISHCSFDLHFSNNERCWAFLIFTHNYKILYQSLKGSWYTWTSSSFLVPLVKTA